MFGFRVFSDGEFLLETLFLARKEADVCECDRLRVVKPKHFSPSTFARFLSQSIYGKSGAEEMPVWKAVALRAWQVSGRGRDGGRGDPVPVSSR